MTKKVLTACLLLLSVSARAQYAPVIVGDATADHIEFTSSIPNTFQYSNAAWGTCYSRFPAGDPEADQWFGISEYHELWQGMHTYEIGVYPRNQVEFAWQDSAHVRLFQPGDTLDGRYDWQKKPAETTTFAPEGYTVPDSLLHSPAGTLTWADEPFLAFRVPEENAYRYGWLKLRLTNHKPGLSIELQEYAIHQSLLIPQGQGLSLYPVPAQGTVTVQLADVPVTAWTLILYDLRGRSVLSHYDHAPQGYYSGELSLEGLAPGLYHAEVVLESTGEVLRQKLLVR